MKITIYILSIFFLTSCVAKSLVKPDNNSQVIIGEWVRKKRISKRVVSYTSFEFLDEENCIYKDWLVRQNNDAIPDSSIAEFSYKIEGDTLHFNLGDEIEPYIETHEIVRLSNNKLKLRFKNNQLVFHRKRR